MFFSPHQTLFGFNLRGNCTASICKGSSLVSNAFRKVFCSHSLNQTIEIKMFHLHIQLQQLSFTSELSEAGVRRSIEPAAECLLLEEKGGGLSLQLCITTNTLRNYKMIKLYLSNPDPTALNCSVIVSFSSFPTQIQYYSMTAPPTDTVKPNDLFIVL
jgi:hypothetical protein